MKPRLSLNIVLVWHKSKLILVLNLLIFYCPECSLDLDTQRHLLEHTDRQNNANVYEKIFTKGDFQDKRNLLRQMEAALIRRDSVNLN